MITLGSYELTHLIGEGGMARLYLATEHGREGLVRRVVVKRILASLTSDPTYTRMLVDEARVVACLQHPNIVQLFALEEAQGAHFLVLEWIDGLDAWKLAHALNETKPSLPRPIALYIAIEMLHGVHAAHTAVSVDGQPLNIVHRDLSASNVLLSRAGAVKVSDFGVAKWIAQTTRTRTGELKGKFSYMSPEQAGGKGVDARSDVYAAALVLFEWLTGERANRGQGQAETLDNAKHGRLDLSPLVAHPRDLADILQRALAKAPSDRYESAEAFARALRDSQSGRLQMGRREDLAELVNRHARMPPPLSPEAIAAWHEEAITEKTPAMIRGTVSVSEPTAAEATAPAPTKRTAPRPGTAQARRPARLGVALMIAMVCGALGLSVFIRTPEAEPTLSLPTPASAPSEPANKPASITAEPIHNVPSAFLSLNSMPWAHVYVDGARLKDHTPILRLRLPSGRHVIRLEAPGINKSRELIIELEPGEHVSKAVDLNR